MVLRKTWGNFGDYRILIIPSSCLFHKRIGSTISAKDDLEGFESINYDAVKCSLLVCSQKDR